MTLTTEQAIEELNDMLAFEIDEFGEVPETEEAVDMAIDALKERKTGKWILTHPLQENDGGAYVCSCCKTGSWEIDPARWKACPWCTALMEVDE